MCRWGAWLLSIRWKIDFELIATVNKHYWGMARGLWLPVHGHWVWSPLNTLNIIIFGIHSISMAWLRGQTNTIWLKLWHCNNAYSGNVRCDVTAVCCVWTSGWGRGRNVLCVSDRRCFLSTLGWLLHPGISSVHPLSKDGPPRTPRTHTTNITSDQSHNRRVICIYPTP